MLGLFLALAPTVHAQRDKGPEEIRAQLHRILTKYIERDARRAEARGEESNIGFCGFLLLQMTTPKSVLGTPDADLDPLLGRIQIPVPMSPDEVLHYYSKEKSLEQEAHFRLLVGNASERPELLEKFGTPLFFALDHFDVRPGSAGFGVHSAVDGLPWYVAVQKSYVHGLAMTALHRDLRREHFHAYLRVLKEAGLRNLNEDEVGIALRLKHKLDQSVTFWALVGERLKSVGGYVPEALRFLPEFIRDEVTKHYLRELPGLSVQVAALAERISREAEARSLYFAVSPESFDDEDHFRDISDMSLSAAERGREVRKQGSFTLLGASTVVLSSGLHELLPAESLGDELGLDPKGKPFRLERVVGARVAELGRYIITRDGVREVGPRLIQEIAAALVGLGDVEWLLIDVSDKGRQAWGDPLGFELVRERVGYNGKPAYLMRINPKDLLKRFLERDYPDEVFTAITGLN